MRAASVAGICLLLLASVISACASSGDDTGGSPTAASTPTATSTPLPSSPTETSTATPEPTVPLIEDWANRVLGLAPVKPANVDLFTTEYLPRPVYPEAYPEGSPMVPAERPLPSTAEVRDELETFLASAFGPDALEVAGTLALFDDEEIAWRVPDARLRAAFVILNITIAEPLIDAFLNSGIYDGKLNWAPTGRAFTEASKTGPDGKRYVWMSERYQHEHFAAVAPSIVHGLLHHDEPFSYSEDAINIAMATVTYLQLVSLHPELAYAGTELTRLNNTFALALLNSHPPRSPDIRLIVPRGAGVLPGSPEDEPDFWTLFGAREGRSPASPAVRSILRNMLTPDTLIPTGMEYSREMAELIDGNISPDTLSPSERVRLSVLFTMISTEEIAALVNASPQEVVEAFGLESIEALIAAGSP